MDRGPAGPGDELSELWRTQHRRLFAIAFRMLGNAREAEDAVQEAFTRLARAEPGTVDDAAGWLVVVVGRICIDTMRSARVRHRADSPDDADPVATGVDPADRVTLGDAGALPR